MTTVWTQIESLNGAHGPSAKSGLHKSSFPTENARTAEPQLHGSLVFWAPQKGVQAYLKMLEMWDLVQKMSVSLLWPAFQRWQESHAIYYALSHSSPSISSFYLAERKNSSLAQFPGSPPFSCTHVSSLSPAVWTWGVAQWCSALLCVTWHFYPALRGAESAVSTWGIPLTSIVSCFKTAFYCQVVKKKTHIRINEMQLIDL